MVKRFAVAVLVVSAMAFSGPYASAAPMIIVGTPGGSLQPTGAPTGNVANGHWDSLSYDSSPQLPGQCTAAGFVGGFGCNWAAPPHDLTIPANYAADPNQPLLYLAGNVAPGEIDVPQNFYFSGDFLFDVAALAQVTAWDANLEFGWYEAGNPSNRSPILSGGPWVNNVAGGPNLDGTGTVLLTGEYGFYYMNTQFANGDPNLATIYYTESMFNQMGAYFSYFSAPEFSAGSALADGIEGQYAANIGTFQQFMLLNQGNTFWLGLEDQFGMTSAAFCHNQEDELMQPCSDYDHNDLVVRMRSSTPVPEPTTLTMLAMGFFGAALALRRRQRNP